MSLTNTGAENQNGRAYNLIAFNFGTTPMLRQSGLKRQHIIVTGVTGHFPAGTVRPEVIRPAIQFRLPRIVEASQFEPPWPQ